MRRLNLSRLAAIAFVVAVLNACGGGGGGSDGGGGGTPAPPTPPVGSLRFALVANETSNTVSLYTVDGTTGVMRANGYTFLGAGAAPVAVAVTPNGAFAYVANSGANNIMPYRMNTVTGAVEAGAPVNTGTNPRAIAVDPNGAFLYVANAGSNTVSGYTISATDGGLGPLGAPVTVGTDPRAVTVDPSGKFLLVANSGANTVSVLPIATDGTLGTAVTSGTGTTPSAVLVDPSGKYVYIANSGSNTVSAFSLAASSGALTPIASPYSTGSQPVALATDPTGTNLSLRRQCRRKHRRDLHHRRDHRRARQRGQRRCADSGEAGQPFRFMPAPDPAHAGGCGVETGNALSFRCQSVSTVFGRDHRFCFHGLLFSHRLPFECEAVSIVHQPVEDRVGERRLVEVGVPLIDRQLACDDRGAAIVAIIEDFQQVTLGLLAHRGEAEVIEHQQLRLGELLEQS